MIKLFYNDTFKNYFLLMLTVFVEEIVFRFFVGFSIIDLSVARIFLGVNFLSLFLVMLYSFGGRIVSNILTFVTALLWTIYALMQITFYNYLGSFISVSEISQFNAVKDYLFEFFGNFRISYLLLTIPLILLALFYIFCEHRIMVLERNDEIDFADKFDSVERKQRNLEILHDKRKNRYFVSKINALIISLFLAGIYFFLLINPLMEKQYQIKSDLNLFLIPDVPELAISQLGYTGYAIADLKDTIYLNIDTKNSYTKEFVKMEQVDSDYMRRIDDSLWVRIAEEEKDKKYKMLNNYYLSQEITDKNDYTGFFKNKNLIIVSVPSLNNIAINKEYYPNIYKMYEEGWSWNNSYTSKTLCAGIDNEISALNSMYPVLNACNGVKYSKNLYPYSLLNLFKNKEYLVNSFYNYTDQFYNREKVHTNLGSDKYYGVQTLGIPYTNQYSEWPSDSLLMERVLKYLKNEDKFMYFVSTSSTNSPYSVSSEIGDRYLDEYKDTSYDITMRRYLSKVKELDNAIGTLLNGLENQKKLDDTVIILYSTNIPFGLSNKILDNYFDYDINYQNNIDKTPFIIYNTEMQGQVFKEYTSIVNIVPTVANLFELDYDPRLYSGKDLFSKTYDNRVIFNNGSWKDSKAYYDSISGVITYEDPNKVYSADELKEIRKIVSERITMSNLAMKVDFFGHLEKTKEDKRIIEIEELSNKNNDE